MSAEADDDATDTAIEFPCDRGCGRWSVLHAVTADGKRVCATCWKRSGSTFPTYRETAQEAALRMDAINRNAIALGGPAAYMVKAGKT